MGIEYVPTPARRHQTIGVAESRRAVLRHLMLPQASHEKPVVVPMEEILERATLLENVMYGGKRLSPFEAGRGYLPSVLGTPSKYVTELY